MSAEDDGAIRAMKTRVEWLADESPDPVHGAWLRHRRPRMQSVYADGTRSDAFVYEHVERRATDAVVLVLYRGDTVLLRTSLRPPLAVRSRLEVPLRDQESDSPMLWEIPAGLIEPEEKGDEGILACAVRETAEETGIVLSPADFEALGAPAFLCPGVIAEQLHYFAADVSAAELGPAHGDGSPVEEGAALAFVPFGEAIELTQDAKTELGLFRLMAHLGTRP